MPAGGTFSLPTKEKGIVESTFCTDARELEFIHSPIRSGQCIIWIYKSRRPKDNKAHAITLLLPGRECHVEVSSVVDSSFS